jgi:hypothetical protein
MTDVPTALLVAQWILLLGLGVLVFLMYRQLAYLLGLSRAVSGGGGLAVGERAPRFEYLVGDGEDGRREVFSPEGTPTLLMLTSPGCGSCTTALKNFEKVTRKIRQDGVRVLAATDADAGTIEAIEAFRDSEIPIVRVDHDVPSRVFRTYTTPYLYAIGPKGDVVGAREAVTAGQIRELVKKLGD